MYVGLDELIFKIVAFSILLLLKNAFYIETNGFNLFLSYFTIKVL